MQTDCYSIRPSLQVKLFVEINKVLFRRETIAHIAAFARVGLNAFAHSIVVRGFQMECYRDLRNRNFFIVFLYITDFRIASIKAVSMLFYAHSHGSHGTGGQCDCQNMYGRWMKTFAAAVLRGIGVYLISGFKVHRFETVFTLISYFC